VEAESLFNDATAAIAFVIVLAIASRESVNAFSVTKALFFIVVGSVLCGAVAAGVVLLLAGATDDHLIEITFTTVAAFGSFLVAEHLHVSGVLATLTAGLMVGNLGSVGSLTDRGREAVESFWEYVAFAVNSLVFL